MTFNSIVFLVFFVSFFIIYWVINNKLPVKIRNLFTIVASYIFYGAWDWRFLSLIIISSAADFTLGLFIDKSINKSQSKILLITSILINIGILGLFKYFNFFVDSFSYFLSLFEIKISLPTLKIILPVGISFYTFQTLSYTIDIYKRKLHATNDVFSFFAFVAFFPQLVAGPIERAESLLPQFFKRKNFSYHSSVDGLRLILWGLFKKVVLADNLGILLEKLYDTTAPLSGTTTLIGALFFAFQIYYDFSGYSDIAIGLARMLDIKLMKNFKTPYFAISLGNFWHRWHISLSSWFRDYIYIPLGGNKCSQFRNTLNLLTTFIISGIWHGAGFTYLIWGFIHGLGLIIEKMSINTFKLGKIFRIPFVFIIVTLLWIPFRAENFTHLINLTTSIINLKTYSFDFITETIKNFSQIKFTLLVITLVIILVIEFSLQEKDFSEWVSSKKRIFRHLIYYFLIIMFLLLYNINAKPDFIYFQF